MDDLKATLGRAIQLAKQVIKWVDEAQMYRQVCQDLLKPRVEHVATLLRLAADRADDLYERPARRVIEDTVKALDKAGLLLVRCRGHVLVSCIFPAGSFKKTGYLLDNSIGDLVWILRLYRYAAADDDLVDLDDEPVGLPPIAWKEPILFFVWEQIVILQAGSLEARAAVAASIVSHARDSDPYRRHIVEEDGVPPLLRLIKEGRADAQESATLAISLLVRQRP